MPSGQRKNNFLWIVQRTWIGSVKTVVLATKSCSFGALLFLDLMWFTCFLFCTKA